MSLAHKNPNKHQSKTMVFIDLGYLKNYLTEELHKDIKDQHLGRFCWEVVTRAFQSDPYSAYVVRIYVYDGRVDPTDNNYGEQKQYHDYLEGDSSNFEVRAGRLIKGKDGKYRQKGVDVLMAIDMVEKANTNRLDVAIVVTGDLDLIEAIQVVKNKGIQIFGCISRKKTSNEFIRALDGHTNLDDLDWGKIANTVSKPKKNST